MYISQYINRFSSHTKFGAVHNKDCTTVTTQTHTVNQLQYEIYHWSTSPQRLIYLQYCFFR